MTYFFILNDTNQIIYCVHSRNYLRIKTTNFRQLNFLNMHNLIQRTQINILKGVRNVKMQIYI